MSAHNWADMVPTFGLGDLADGTEPRCEARPRKDAWVRSSRTTGTHSNGTSRQVLYRVLLQMTCHLQVISEAFTLTRSTLDAGFATSFGGGTDGWSRVAISIRDSRSPAHLPLLVGHPGREAEHHVSGAGQRPGRHSGTPASLGVRRHSRLIRPRLCPTDGLFRIFGEIWKKG